MWALRASRPPHGVSEVPAELDAFREFDAVVGDILLEVDRKASVWAKGMAVNKVYGPWEGGLPVEEIPCQASATSLPPVVLASNVAGAFGLAGGVGAADHKIIAFSSWLHDRGVILAVISEPCLPPGAIWPQVTGYIYHGQRSATPDSVAVLILAEASANVVVLPDIGSARAIWLQLPPVRRGGAGTLVLAVYGPPTSFDEATRRAFWHERAREHEHLRTQPRYAGWAVIVLGEFNLHFGFLVVANC